MPKEREANVHPVLVFGIILSAESLCFLAYVLFLDFEYSGNYTKNLYKLHWRTLILVHLQPSA